MRRFLPLLLEIGAVAFIILFIGIAIDISKQYPK